MPLLLQYKCKYFKLMEIFHFPKSLASILNLLSTVIIYILWLEIPGIGMQRQLQKSILLHGHKLLNRFLDFQLGYF